MKPGDWVAENAGYDNGVLSVGSVSIDTGFGIPEEETDEGEVIFLNNEPAPFPWAWIAAGGLILAVFYMADRR